MFVWKCFSQALNIFKLLESSFFDLNDSCKPNPKDRDVELEIFVGFSHTLCALIKLCASIYTKVHFIFY